MSKSEMKPRELFISGINFNEYQIKGDGACTAFITLAHPGKTETIKVIEHSAYLAALELIERLEETLGFYKKYEREDNFQNKFTESTDWIECAVSYRLPSKASNALADIKKFREGL